MGVPAGQLWRVMLYLVPVAEAEKVDGVEAVILRKVLHRVSELTIADYG